MRQFMHQDQREHEQHDQADIQDDEHRPRVGIYEKDQYSRPDQQEDVGEEGIGLTPERAIRAEVPGSAQPLLGGKCLFHIRLKSATVAFHEDSRIG
jgi:hypothetical protein